MFGGYIIPSKVASLSKIACFEYNKKFISHELESSLSVLYSPLVGCYMENKENIICLCLEV